jgi:hypothetical protein
MKVWKLIQILATVCKYNAEGRVFVRMGDTMMEIDHCEDDNIDCIGKVLVLIPTEVSQ